MGIRLNEAVPNSLRICSRLGIGVGSRVPVAPGEAGKIGKNHDGAGGGSRGYWLDTWENWKDVKEAGVRKIHELPALGFLQ